ncbi:nose resistant to fluoxetine protein 6-like [Ctenocephalides felis]|uniref:nose resistant to fluoxetine protein 6-like n=1 Tax=Ctenocephalides felis TaxID=7515 RepID=UPI000E6E2AE6|nr:nose resistant to fluoxetine protein 6-like [Ctenocephalides felis]
MIKYKLNFDKGVFQDPRHFRHDLPVRGVCLNWCQLGDSYMPGEDLSRQYNKLEVKPNLVQNSSLEETLDRCLQREFKQYGIRAEILRVGCRTGERPDRDALDWIVTFICFLLAILCIWATVFEFLNRRKSQDINYYKKPLKTPCARLLSCFSVKRNYFRLVTTVDEENKLFRSIQGIRFLTMASIVNGHSLMYGADHLPIRNTNYIEELYSVPTTQFIINGTNCVQAYLGISALLMANGLIEYSKKHKVNFQMYIVAAIYRYIRLTIPMAAMILISATWSVHFGDGPFWNEIVGNERKFCRTNWWANIFYINNYFSTDACLQQTWYLAADTQLFMVMMPVVIICIKYPRLMRYILGSLLVVSLIIPAVITYVNNYFPGPQLYPEIIRNLLYVNAEYRDVYVPGHTNGSTYIIGIIFAFLLEYLKEHKIDMKKKKWFVTLWLLLVPIGLLNLLSGYVFYRDGFEIDATVSAIYVTYYKVIYGVMVGIFTVGAAHGIGWWGLDFLCWGPMQGLGRLSYAAYLIHPLLLRVLHANVRVPLYLTETFFMDQTVSAISLSFLIGFIFSLMVELPTSALQKLTLPKKKDNNSEEQIKETELLRVDTTQSQENTQTHI